MQLSDTTCSKLEVYIRKYRKLVIFLFWRDKNLEEIQYLEEYFMFIDPSLGYVIQYTI